MIKNKFPFESSIVSFPDRGKWGNNKYPGNCTGYIQAGFLDQWHKKRDGLFVDPMEGGGTSKDVAFDLGIEYYGFDLKRGFDALTQDLRSLLPREAHTAFVHPPYKDMIAYNSGNNDLSKFENPYDFLEWCQLALMNLYNALESGGHYAVLMGNMRKAGKFFPLATRLNAYAPGEQVHEIIKIQHNTTSGFRNSNYGNNFIPTLHETLMVFKKPLSMIYAIDVALYREQVAMRISEGTWRNLIRLTLMNEPALSLAEIYERVEGSPKAKNNRYWKEKVRQTVTSYPEFNRVELGTYQLAMEII